MRLSSEVLEVITEVDMRLWRLDALHLASPLRFGEDLSSFVVGDPRLLRVAHAANPVTASLGRDPGR